ncbi:hypothetical protein IX51_02305 [uncultured archaeon]|nr:hypothetical protein IX51_02305 [uncultured archaeon]
MAVVDFLIFISVFYFVPSTSPYYTPLYYLVDFLSFFAVIIAWQSIRSARRVVYKTNRRFIYSTIEDDSDTDEYKQKLKEASDLYLQGGINSDEEFFTVLGEHTPKEERIFRALKGARQEFGKMGRR